MPDRWDGGLPAGSPSHLVGLALTCLGIYTVTALSFKERQMDTLRQQQIQVNHPLPRQQGVRSGTLRTSSTMAWSADRT